MKNDRFIAAFTALTFSCAFAQADWITSWGDGVEGTDWTINQDVGTIVIRTGNGHAYKFYSETALNSGQPGSINSITIAPTGVTGDFSLLIDHQTVGQPGCRDWRAGDLRYSGGTCTITGIDVARWLLSNAAGSSDIFCESIVGDIHVGNSLGKDANAILKVFKADSVVGNVTLGNPDGGAFANLDFGGFQGDLTIGNTPIGARTPCDVTIRSSYSGTITFNDPTGYEGHIHIVNGDFSGLIYFPTGVMFGAVEIDGDFIVPGRIDCDTYFDRENGGDPPSVHVHGSLANPNDIESNQPMITSGVLFPDGGLRGVIAIDGDLKNAVTAGPEIKVWTIRDPFEDPPGEPTARGAIAVDYDGWDDGDDWEEGATVEEWFPPVPNPTFDVYEENTPVESVYEITPCRGDVNNDGQVTSADIYPLTLARLLPGIGLLCG